MVNIPYMDPMGYNHLAWIRYFSRWWQLKYLWNFTPIWGIFPIWRASFSDGLVQPPTSFGIKNLKLNLWRDFGWLPDLPTWKNGGDSVLLSCFILFFLGFKLLHLLLFPTKKRRDVLPLPEATCWHQRRWWDRHCWWNPYRPFGDDGQMTSFFGCWWWRKDTFPVPSGPFASYKAGGY